MDLGCIDMGCVEKKKKENSVEKENSPKESVMSASKLGKNNKAKDVMRSSLSALNKLTSQITKPPHRKTSSPLNWFPRKKVEPYLKRKIKMLQEVDGMSLTLDETLGDSNPHYSRVLREKMAIREAAEKAVEARKAAMVEASWCRILQAARIESKEAEAQLSKAEISASEAFEAARAVGVIMNEIPDSAQNQYITETMSAKGGSNTHAISATFETAFEVDKQVAAAVKVAFIKLANCPSIDKDEFKELLRKISENPDTDENYNDLSGFTSECESDAGSEMETGLDKDCLKKHKKRQEMDRFNMANIVDVMLGRLQCLKEDELASLATIVATSGLSAALAETENSKQHAALSSSIQNAKNPCPKVSKRMSVNGGRTARKADAAELPSLDKFLVKRLTRLERELLEAKKARKNEASEGSEPKLDDVADGDKLPSVDDTSSRTEVKIKDDTTIPDLGSVLMKHSSKLEKEIEEARMNGKSSEIYKKKCAKQNVADVPSLDKYLVKHLTRLEREIQEARNSNRLEPTGNAETTNSEETIPFSSNVDSEGKENMNLNKMECRNISTNISHEDASSKTSEDQNRKRKEAETKVFPESDHNLPRGGAIGVQKKQCKDGGNYESLDKVLVKHVSRLEKEKLAFCGDDQLRVKPKRKDMSRELESDEGSLDQVLVKHKSRLEKAKMAASEEQPDNSTRHSVSRRQARDKELEAAWGGLSLGNSIRPHVSKLQREKAAWLKAEEEERNREEATEEEMPCML